MYRALVILILLGTTSLVSFAQNQVTVDSLELALKNAGPDSIRLQLMLEIGRYYGNHDFAKAILYAQQLIDLAKKKESKTFESKGERFLGGLFFNMSNYKLASLHFFNALKVYENTHDSVGIFTVTLNLGAIYDRLQEHDKALEYYLKAQTLIGRIKIDPQLKSNYLTSLYNNIAGVYQINSDFQSARDYYEKALQLAREVDNKTMQGILLNNLGKLYTLDIPNPDLAYKYLEEGLQIRESLGNKNEISKSYRQFSTFHLHQKHYDEARRMADVSLKLGEEVGSLENQHDAFENIWLIETERKNYPEALYALTQFKKFSDSVQRQQAGSELAKLQLQYDLEKAEQANLLEQNQLKARYTLAIFALTGGLLIAILLVIVVRSRAQRIELKQKNLAQDIEIKNKELTTNVMYLVRKNELINDVAERLLEFKKLVAPESQKTINDIVLDLQREADSASWKEFEIRFNQVHSDFYDTLRKLYPDLSPADEKLCAFLRLNMSSKEIAAITSQSVKSVEVARARLRKKLNLTNTTSNLVTHLSNL